MVKTSLSQDRIGSWHPFIEGAATGVIITGFLVCSIEFGLAAVCDVFGASRSGGVLPVCAIFGFVVAALTIGLCLEISSREKISRVEIGKYGLAALALIGILVYPLLLDPLRHWIETGERDWSATALAAILALVSAFVLGAGWAREKEPTPLHRTLISIKGQS